ncbi:MAG: hypothetical protein P8X74_09600 [Reinekea sp.]
MACALRRYGVTDSGITSLVQASPLGQGKSATVNASPRPFQFTISVEENTCQSSMSPVIHVVA